MVRRWFVDETAMNAPGTFAEQVHKRAFRRKEVQPNARQSDIRLDSISGKAAGAYSVIEKVQYGYSRKER